MSYNTNNITIAIALIAIFWLAMAAIGYYVLKLIDNRWRFSVRMMLAIITIVAILCVCLKIMMYVPKRERFFPPLNRPVPKPEKFTSVVARNFSAGWHETMLDN